MKVAAYKGTRAGWEGLYNRFVRWWTRGQYSHMELIFSDGVAASSSFIDGGVRFKKIVFDPANWDFIDLPAELETAARAWFTVNNGKAYDILGELRFFLGPVSAGRDKWFCSAAVMDALGYGDSWRFEPNIAAKVLAHP